jgi:rhamnogalacturonyl hydrolase YesR
MRSFFAACVFTMLLAVSALAQPSSRAGEDYRNLTHDGAWCWFADPRAVRYVGQHDRTYAGWVGSRGDIVVGWLDNRTGEVRSHVVARRFERDDHANPSLRILPDGRLIVFYSKHADSVMRLRVSTQSEDISAWSDEQQLALNDPAQLKPGHPNATCYPNPIALDGDRVALLWRGTNWKPCIAFSEDGGLTWGKGRVMLTEPGAGAGNRPYLKAALARDLGDGPGIHLAFTTGHPRNEPLNSVHYLLYRSGRFFRADGSVVGTLDDMPIAPSSCDVVYDAKETGVRAWVWDVAEDERGRPVIAYTRLPDETRHVYHVARFDGTQWQDSALVDGGAWFPQTQAGKVEREPHYSGGIVLDHDDPRAAYLSRPVLGVFEIERWRREGATWTGEPVTAGSRYDNVRPFVVRHHPGGAGPRVLWMHINGKYEHYTKYKTTIKMDLPEPPPDVSLAPADVLALMERVATWQLDNPAAHGPTNWTTGAMCAGIMALADISDDDHYERAMLALGEANGWQPGRNKFFADDHCIGQMYLSLYARHENPAMIGPIRAVFDAMIEEDADESLEWKGNVHLRQWAWCDALFMAPPTLAMLAEATGDRRYLDLLDRRWWKTVDYLYDPAEHLFYRDSRYFEKREPNGRKVFWSRGNGWVIAGLARVLEALPADHPTRDRYERLFVEMAERIASLQQPDGFWHASLLDPASYPNPETSGTGFHCFALAWGINHGLLDAGQYRPVVERAWRALSGSVDANGMLRWVQPVGADPRQVREHDTDIFGVGALLLAGREVYEMELNVAGGP